MIYVCVTPWDWQARIVNPRAIGPVIAIPERMVETADRIYVVDKLRKHPVPAVSARILDRLGFRWIHSSWCLPNGELVQEDVRVSSAGSIMRGLPRSIRR